MKMAGHLSQTALLIQQQKQCHILEKTSCSGIQNVLGQFSFQSQRKVMTKNAQTTSQLHSSHTLAK